MRHPKKKTDLEALWLMSLQLKIALHLHIRALKSKKLESDFSGNCLINMLNISLFNVCPYEQGVCVCVGV